MAGINVNQLTSMLAKLQPDSALQKYALDNKNDPYIVSLAASESNRRKELRSAAQAAAAGQPQPKVADAAIAQMAPQEPVMMMAEGGIATLSAPNMQQMADGGIAGYDEGYDEGGMAYSQDPVMMMAEGGVARYNGMQGSLTGDIPGFVAGTGNFIPQQGAPEEVPLLRRLFRDARAAGTSYQVEQAKARIAAGVGTSADEAVLAAAQPTERKGPSPQDMAQFDAASNLYMTERANKQAAGAAPKVDAAPKADTTRKGPGAGAGPAAARANAADPFSMDAIRKAQAEAMGDSKYQIGALNNQLVEIRNKAETQVQQRLDDRKKEIESEGDVYKDRSDRLVERAKGLAAQKNENTGLALLNAGLAIMSTPGKLMEAIGKGAQVGTAQYAAGIKNLRAAQERLDDANDRIAELRLNRKDLNSREIRALEKDRDNAILDGQKMVFGFAKDVYGMDRKQAEATFTSYMSGQEKKAEIQGRKDVAGMQIRADNARAMTPDKLVFDQLTKQYGGDTVKAAEALQRMKTEKFNVYDAYSKYLQAFAGKDTLKGPDDFDVFAKRFIPTVTPNKNTTIRTQPGG
jgi:hypothetical protein